MLPHSCCVACSTALWAIWIHVKCWFSVRCSHLGGWYRKPIQTEQRRVKIEPATHKKHCPLIDFKSNNFYFIGDHKLVVEMNLYQSNINFLSLWHSPKTRWWVHIKVSSIFFLSGIAQNRECLQKACLDSDQYCANQSLHLNRIVGCIYIIAKKTTYEQHENNK